MKRILSVFTFLLLIIYGCSTDFDVTAPYKEIIVVDGLLNEVDTLQSIRISKAFLGEGNAYTMAQQSDSINYADVLDVQMDEIHNGIVLNTFPLTRSEKYDKDSGIFHYPFHVLYTTNYDIIQDNEYRIRVTNTETGTAVSSLTKIVGDVDMRRPLPPNGNPVFDYINLASQWPTPYVVTYGAGVNSKLYDLILRFHYREIDPFGNSNEYSFDWNFADKNTPNSDNELKFSFYKYDLFALIGSTIPDKPGYIRRVDSLSNSARAFEFITIVGTEDLDIYNQLLQPSTGVVQEFPTFTTVTNGLGLFTSRLIHSFSYYPDALTEDSLQNSQYTRTKNFQF